MWYCKSGQKSMAQSVTGHRQITTIVLLNGIVSTATTYFYIYNHKLMLLSVLVREAYFCSGQHSIKEIITSKYAENK